MKLTFSPLDNAIYHGTRVKRLASLFQIVPFILIPGAFYFFEYFEPKWKEDPFLILILALFVVGQLFSFFQYIKLRRGAKKAIEVLRSLSALWKVNTKLKEIAHFLEKNLPSCHLRDIVIRWVHQGETGDTSGFDYLLDNSANRRQHSEDRMLSIHVALNRASLKLGFLGTLIGLLMTFPPMKEAILALKDVDGEMKFVSDIAGAIDGDQYAILTTLLATGFSVLIEILVIQVISRLIMRFEMVNNYLEEWNIVEFRPRVLEEFGKHNLHDQVLTKQLAMEQNMIAVQDKMMSSLALVAESLDAMQGQFQKLATTQDVIGKTVSELAHFEQEYQKFVRSRFNPLDNP